MRTLKKTLCLVLCLAMMVGLCAVGASAVHYEDYPDTEEIKYVEAVKFLTELGVVEGDEGGFRATDTLTRAEAAKLIVALQGIKLEDISNLTSSFSDMDTAAWAQPYVGWLQAQKIVEGVGNGKFNPGETLKFVDFAAMLLRTLGYDKDRELMTGKTYELGVLKLINKLNLARGIKGYDYAAPITREEAAQLAFTALRKNMVDYKESTLDNVSVDENGNLLPGLRERIPNAAYDYRSDGAHRVFAGETAELMIERYWPSVKLITGTDFFGVPTETWFMGDSQSDYVYAPSKLICRCETVGVLAEYTTDAKTAPMSQLYTDGGMVRKTTIRVLENGVPALVAVKNDDGEEIGTADKTLTLDAYSSAILNYGGATVLLVDDGNEITNAAITNYNENWYDDGMADTAIVKYAYIAMVTDIIPADESDSGRREVELLIYNKADGEGNAIPVGGVHFITDDFSKYDYVLVYPSGNSYTTGKYERAAQFEAGRGILMVTPIETRDGTVTKTGLRNGVITSLTVGGEVSTLANFAYMGMEGKTVPASAYRLNTKLVLYMNNGYVLGVEGEAPTYTNYVFKINDGYGRATEDVTLPSYDAWSKVPKIVGYVKQDASTGTATVNVVPENGWYTMRTTKGVTTFVEPQGKASQIVATAYDIISAKDPKLGWDEDGYQVTADAKTEFVFYTKNGYVHYTGLSNIPTFEGNEAKIYALVVGGIAKAVFVDLWMDGVGNWTAKTAAVPAIFMLGKAPTSVEFDENAGYIYTYNAFVDGKKGTVKSTMQYPVSDNGMALGDTTGQVLVPSYDDDGFLESANYLEPDEGDRLGAGKITVSNGTFVIDLGTDKAPVAYATTAATLVYYYNASTGKFIEGGAPIEISGKTGDYITVIPANGAPGTAGAIYVYAK